MGEGPHFVFCGHIIWQEMEACKNNADSKGLNPLAGSVAEPRLNITIILPRRPRTRPNRAIPATLR